VVVVPDWSGHPAMQVQVEDVAVRKFMRKVFESRVVEEVRRGEACRQSFANGNCGHCIGCALMPSDTPPPHDGCVWLQLRHRRYKLTPLQAWKLRTQSRIADRKCVVRRGGRRSVGMMARANGDCMLL
jgi:hypothetical protein